MLLKYCITHVYCIKNCLDKIKKKTPNYKNGTLLASMMVIIGKYKTTAGRGLTIHIEGKY